MTDFEPAPKPSVHNMTLQLSSSDLQSLAMRCKYVSLLNSTFCIFSMKESHPQLRLIIMSSHSSKRQYVTINLVHCQPKCFVWSGNINILIHGKNHVIIPNFIVRIYFLRDAMKQEIQKKDWELNPLTAFQGCNGEIFFHWPLASYEK